MMVYLGRNLTFVRQLPIHSRWHSGRRSDKQRSVFDWETRTATQLNGEVYDNMKAFFVHRNSLLLPCGFLAKTKYRALFVRDDSQ